MDNTIILALIFSWTLVPIVTYWTYLQGQRRERKRWSETVDDMCRHAHSDDYRLRDVLHDLREVVTGSRF